MTKTQTKLEDLDRPALVQAAKDAGVPAKGKSPDLIKAIEAKRAENTKTATPEPDAEPDAAVAAEGDGGDTGPQPSDEDAPTAEDRDEPSADHVTRDDETRDSDGGTPEVEADPALGKITHSLDIEKATDRAWWCPFDDHSMESKETRCAKCGAVREGSQAVRR